MEGESRSAGSHTVLTLQNYEKKVGVNEYINK